MAFGIDDLILALGAAAAAKNALDPTLPNQPNQAAPPGGSPAPAEGPLANKAPATSAMPAPVNANASQAVAQQAAANAPTPDPGQPAPAPKSPEMQPFDWAKVLAASPQAIAAIAPLLGLGPEQEQRPTVLPAVGGPSSGNSVFGMPQRNSLGDLLASLRLR